MQPYLLHPLQKPTLSSQTSSPYRNDKLKIKAYLPIETPPQNHS